MQQDPSIEIKNHEGESTPPLSSRTNNKYYDLAVDIESYFDKHTINSHGELLSWARFLEKNNLSDEKILNLVFENIEDKCPSQKTFKKTYERFQKLQSKKSTLPAFEEKQGEENISAEDLERLKEYGIIKPTEEAEQ